MTSSDPQNLVKLVGDDSLRWSEAHNRLKSYLESYLLKNSLHEAEVTREILLLAVARHKAHPEEHPTTCTMKTAYATISQWFTSAMKQEKVQISNVQALPIGHITLLLSQVPQKFPTAFLSPEVPERLRRFFTRSLMMTGPTLNVASMTPRQLDYGPMLHLAQQTWHLWDTRRFMQALFFWACVYAILYSLGYYILRLPAYNV